MEIIMCPGKQFVQEIAKECFNYYFMLRRFLSKVNHLLLSFFLSTWLMLALGWESRERSEDKWSWGWLRMGLLLLLFFSFISGMAPGTLNSIFNQSDSKCFLNSCITLTSQTEEDRQLSDLPKVTEMTEDLEGVLRKP